MKAALFPFIFILSVMILILYPDTGKAQTTFIFKGRVLDNDGKPVEGGEVFVYETPQIRRPADFISPRSNKDGLYRTELPTGHYWVVARVRGDAGYGPLSIGKRHSGEAVEIEGADGSEVVLDFIVADVREMAKSQRKTTEDYCRVEGRILEQGGKPAQGVYAFARGEKSKAQLPDFISPVSDDEGRYIIYIPLGRFCLGAAATFPPEEGIPCKEMLLDSATIVTAKDLQLHHSESKNEKENQDNEDID
jgi:hypothetical protein